MSEPARTDSAPPAEESPAGGGSGREPAGETSSRLRRALLAAGVIALGLWVSLPTLAIILALVFMLFVHELGHYLTAKAAGMKVTEFFIGFGPRIWSFRRGETEYGIKPIPAGAYVRIIGMSNLEEVDPAEESRTYRQKPYWRRLSVAVAGSAMHFLMAIGLMFAILSVIGTPAYDSERWTVGSVAAGSAAEAAGLEVGDRILAADGNRFDTFQALAAYFRDHPGEEVDLIVERDGREVALSTTLGTSDEEGEPVGFLGVGAEFPVHREGPVSGLVEAVQTTGETMWLSVEALGQFFSPEGLSGYVDTLMGTAPTAQPGEIEGENRVISPVAAVQIGSAAASDSVVDALSFLFIINVFIGVFNMVPLLPLDGGHVAIATYERIRSRKGRRYFADVGKLMPLTYAVVALLVMVGVTALYLDIVDPIRLQ